MIGLKTPKNPFGDLENRHIMDMHADQFEQFSKGTEHTFSDAYNVKKAALLSGHKKSRHTRKLVIAVVVILLSLCLAACSKPVREFFIRVYEEFTSYFSIGQAYVVSDLSVEITTPEDYVLADEILQDTIYIATYEQKGGEPDVLQIAINTSADKKNNINNENADTKEITINGWSCYLMVYTDKPETALYCDMDVAVVEIVGMFSVDELIQLVEGMDIRLKNE